MLNKKREDKNKIKRVAAYCRVSTDFSDQANSLENQKRYFCEFINKNPDYRLYEIFADKGISGTSTNNRNEFKRMISLAGLGKFDLIITKEISRFARNTLDSIYYTRKLKEYGVGVVFMNDNINTLESDSELRLSIMASIAQEESRKTSERVKWGQKRRMEQGVVFGNSLLGYDVKNGKVYINEKGAKTVRLIFEKFVYEKKGASVIARELDNLKIKPMKSEFWQSSVILKILKNEKYCGDLVQKKSFTPDFLSHQKKKNNGEEEFVIIKNHHQPIVSRELFEKANEILENKRKNIDKSKFSNRYLLSGKIKCGECLSNFVSRYKTLKNGSVYKSWRCYNRVKFGSKSQSDNNKKCGCFSPSIKTENTVKMIETALNSVDFDLQKQVNQLLKIIFSVTKNNQYEIKNFVLKNIYSEEFYCEMLEKTVVYNDKVNVYLKGILSEFCFLSEHF